MARSGSGSYVGGVILVAVGFGLLARRFLPFGWEQALLLALGLAFGLLGILRRSYGSLVAGMVLLGVGAGLVLGDRQALGLAKVHWLMLCLGLGFACIYLFGLLLQMRKHWWPLVPAAVLLVFGGGDSLWRLQILPPSMLEAVRVWWPVILVVFGGYLLLRAFRK
jgi:hypothetical protein